MAEELLAGCFPQKFSYIGGMYISIIISGFFLAKRGHVLPDIRATLVFMEGDRRSKEDAQHREQDTSSSSSDEQEVSPEPGDLEDVREEPVRDVHSSVSTESETQDVGGTGDKQRDVAIVSNLPQFDELLPQDSPKPSRKSKPQRKAVKRSLSVGSSSESHTVSKHRRILPKGDTESRQPTSEAVSPASLAEVLLTLSGFLAMDVVDGSEPPTSTSGGLRELSAGDVDVIEDDDDDPTDPRPGPSGVSARPSTLPLTVQSSTSSSQGSPSLAATTDEVVKSFVYEEDEEVNQAAVASQQSQSVLPLIKEELRTKIQLRRLWSGGDELQIEPKREEFKLSLEEVKKRERKKAQNRRSATKSREKQARSEEMIIQRSREEETKNKILKREKQELLEEKDNYLTSLTTHLDTECSLPIARREEDAKLLKQYSSQLD